MNPLDQVTVEEVEAQQNESEVGPGFVRRSQRTKQSNKLLQDYMLS